MKKLVLFSLMLTALVGVLAACSKDDEGSAGAYYVKYEYQHNVGNSSYYSTTRVATQITYKDTDLERSFNMSGNSWQGTYGPFQRGDTVYMIIRRTLKSGDWSNFSSNATISISKNDEPFSIKAAGQASLEYVIE